MLLRTFPGIYSYLCPHLRLLSRVFSSGMYSYFWTRRMSINATKWTFLILCFLSAFFNTSFHSFSIVASAPGKILLGVQDLSLILQSFPKHASLRDRISRVFWTIRNSRIPEVRWSEPQSEFILLSSQVTLESISYSPGFEVYLKKFVSQIRCAARRDNMCLPSPSKKIKWKAFLRSFHRNEFVPEVVIEYRVPSFPTKSIKLNLILPHMFGLLSIHPAASYISSRKSFVH